MPIGDVRLKFSQAILTLFVVIFLLRFFNCRNVPSLFFDFLNFSLIFDIFNKVLVLHFPFGFFSCTLFLFGSSFFCLDFWGFFIAINFLGDIFTISLFFRVEFFAFGIALCRFSTGVFVLLNAVLEEFSATDWARNSHFFLLNFPCVLSLLTFCFHTRRILVLLTLLACLIGWRVKSKWIRFGSPTHLRQFYALSRCPLWMRIFAI